MSNIQEQERQTPKEIVDENFKGLDDLIEDEDLRHCYKELIVTCIEDYAEQEKAFIAGASLKGNDWVSVLDGLPEIDESDEWNKKHKISKDVFVWVVNYKLLRGRYYHESGHWTCDGHSSTAGIILTHWMPLPTPPPSPIKKG